MYFMYPKLPIDFVLYHILLRIFALTMPAIASYHHDLRANDLFNLPIKHNLPETQLVICILMLGSSVQAMQTACCKHLGLLFTQGHQLQLSCLYILK